MAMTAALEFQTPHSLRADHDRLHADLAALTNEPGVIGDAARDVARLLHPHFVKEEEYALPPLGLLASIARGEIDRRMEPVVTMARRIKSELPMMISEHREIVRSLDRLAAAAVVHGRAHVADFVDKLKLHAETEEDVLYPAAIIVGEIVEAHLARMAATPTGNPRDAGGTQHAVGARPRSPAEPQ
jgi:hypothetical protein